MTLAPAVAPEEGVGVVEAVERATADARTGIAALLRFRRATGAGCEWLVLEQYCSPSPSPSLLLASILIIVFLSISQNQSDHEQASIGGEDHGHDESDDEDPGEDGVHP